MISCESKAWVDEKKFPTINIFEDGSFQVNKNGVLVFNGHAEFKADSIVFNLNNKTQLLGVYVDTGKTMLRISRLENIDVEAKYGEFKEITADKK